MTQHITQTMAECDCSHEACALRKYCMAAEIARLRDALTMLIPHVKTGRELAEFAAGERQDTPAIDALADAFAALEAKP